MPNCPLCTFSPELIFNPHHEAVQIACCEDQTSQCRGQVSHNLKKKNPSLQLRSASLSSSVSCSASSDACSVGRTIVVLMLRRISYMGCILFALRGIHFACAGEST
ncbi:hypothetical protein M758_3G032600 [Ceratodon purpureus]|nr:hypothetical protein M758_3G032600 [Ceratodon purpureus]